MSKLKDWITSKLFWLRTGYGLVIPNGGKSVEEVVIRYKGLFFMIMLDAESGEPTGDFGWSQGTAMTHVPIRDFYTATRDPKTDRLFCTTGCRTAKCVGLRSESEPRKATGSRVKHTHARRGKRVRITLHSGEQFVAKLKDTEGRFHTFYDHDKVKSSLVRQLTILKADYKEPAS